MENWVRDTFVTSPINSGKTLAQERMMANLSSSPGGHVQDPKKLEGASWATYGFERVPQSPLLQAQHQLWEMRLTAKEAHRNYQPPSCSSRHWGEICRCKSRVWYRIIDGQTGACVWQTLGAHTEGPATKKLVRAVGTLWKIEVLKDQLRRT